MTLDDLFAIFYPAGLYYFALLIFQSLCSYWIFRHVSRESQATYNSLNTSRRIRKERRVLARLALPVILLLCAGLIYMSYFVVTWITNSVWQIPPYGLHLSFLSSEFAIGLAMFANILLQKQVQEKSLSIVQQRIVIHQDNALHPTVQQYPKF